jgi:hypothetical protein
MSPLPFLYALSAAACLMMASGANADAPPAFDLVIRNARFIPERIEVPANTRFRLIIKNEGPGAEEFESIELRKEKVITPGSTAILNFTPLKPGTYRFFGEFHPETAQGLLIAR